MKSLVKIIVLLISNLSILCQTGISPSEYLRLKTTDLLILKNSNTTVDNLINRRQVLNINYAVNSQKEIFIANNVQLVSSIKDERMKILMYDGGSVKEYSNVLPEYFQEGNDKIISTQLKFDNEDNLLLLLDFYLKESEIYRFNFEKNLFVKIPIDKQINSNTFYVNFSNDILLYTFSVNDLVDNRNWDLGNVFVFNEEGKYQRRSKYFIQDSEGSFYKGNFSINNFIIKKYQNNNSMTNLNENSLVTVGEMKIPLQRNVNERTNRTGKDRWFYIGIDNSSQIYYANSTSVAKINFSSDKIEYLDYSSIFKDNFYATHEQIRVNNRGNVFIMSLTSSMQNVTENQLVDPEKTEIVFFELKYK